MARRIGVSCGASSIIARVLADESVIVAMLLAAQLDFLIVVLPMSAPRLVEERGVSKDGDDQHADGRDEEDCRRKQYVVHESNPNTVPVCE